MLGNLGNGLDVPTVNGDIHEVGRGRRVIIPDTMVDHLEVPGPFSGFCVQRHQALAEQVVTGPVAAIKIIGRCFYGQVDQTQFGVCTHHGPDPGITGTTPGLLAPGFNTKLAFPGYGVKGPGQFTLGQMIATDEQRGTFLVAGAIGGDLRGNQNIVDNNRR